MESRGEAVHELLSSRGGGGMLGDVEVDDAPAVVSEHDEDEENAEASGGHGEDPPAYRVNRESRPSIGRCGVGDSETRISA